MNSFVYVLDVLNDVECISNIILAHLKTIYPTVTDIINYSFEDGVMFVPLIGTEYLYEDLDYVDYEKYRGMIPIVDCGLMRYILGKFSIEGHYLGKIVLLESDVDKVNEEIEYLRSECYFAPDVDSPQHVSLYSELASLWGTEVILKEYDYIVLKGCERLLDYVPSVKEFFERWRDIFPKIPKLLVNDEASTYSSLYQLELDETSKLDESNNRDEIPLELTSSDVEVNVYKDMNMTRIDVRDKDIFDFNYYDRSVEQVKEDWVSGNLLTDHCKVMIRELGILSFYTLKRD
uniref:Uncharacterized protein n=1 Tax=Pithovirus LCPAC403 TaxID=2506596 RepID=A0A481ZBI3_9VIRU|nr:MAG: uncharacterized protein LCPAC403_03980 [Pithovirus LCPAC403]